MAKMSNPELSQRMFRLVKMWIAGNETKKVFCRKQNININTFGYWLQKFRKMNPEETKGEFIQIRNPENSNRNNTVRLYFPGGVRAEFPADTDCDILVKLIRSV